MKRTAQNVIASVGLLASMACLLNGPAHTAPAVIDYQKSFPTLLQPGWTTTFTTLTAPVVNDNAEVTGSDKGKYIAVFGNMNNGAVSTELRVLRILVDKTDTSDGEERDYPFGIKNEHGDTVTAPITSNRYTPDAHQGNGIEECFRYKCADIGVTKWLGAPVFKTIQRSIDGGVSYFDSTVLYALALYGTEIRPVCIAISPYISSNSNNTQTADTQAGNILWIGDPIDGGVIAKI